MIKYLWLKMNTIQFVLTKSIQSDIKEMIILFGNPFWDSKPELFSDVACLRIPYQPCIVLFGIFFSGTPTSNRRELRLHLNVLSTGAGVEYSKVDIFCLPMMPDRAHHSQAPLQIHRHFDLFWKYVMWSLFPLRGIVYSIHLIYRYWGILFFLHEELLLLIFK